VKMCVKTADDAVIRKLSESLRRGQKVLDREIS